jgi:hypothetical protein
MADEGGEATLDILIGRGPGGDADAAGGEDLVEGDFVEDRDIVPGEDRGKAAGVAAAALQRFEFGAGIEVAGSEAHGAGEGLGAADKEDAAVIGDIKPFMAVGGPGIGGGVFGGGGPEAEGAIDADAGIRLFGTLPAWRQTMAGWEREGKASGRMRPWESAGTRMTRSRPRPRDSTSWPWAASREWQAAARPEKLAMVAPLTKAPVAAGGSDDGSGGDDTGQQGEDFFDGQAGDASGEGKTRRERSWD